MFSRHTLSIPIVSLHSLYPLLFLTHALNTHVVTLACCYTCVARLLNRYDGEDLASRRVPDSPPNEGIDFDSAKDDIYREVAFFIAGNEENPMFLLDFFRVAQQLGSNAQKNGAIEAMRDLLAAPPPPFDSDRNFALEQLVYAARPGGPLDGVVGGMMDGVMMAPRPASREHRDRSYDYEEAVEDGVDVPTDDDGDGVGPTSDDDDDVDDDDDGDRDGGGGADGASVLICPCAS
jgi:hypothetical protein